MHTNKNGTNYLRLYMKENYNIYIIGIKKERQVGHGQEPVKSSSVSSTSSSSNFPSISFPKSSNSSCNFWIHPFPTTSFPTALSTTRLLLSPISQPPHCVLPDNQSFNLSHTMSTKGCDGASAWTQLDDIDIALISDRKPVISTKTAFTLSKMSFQFDLDCLLFASCSGSLSLRLAKLFLSDGSNGNLRECHLEKNELWCTLSSRPAAEKRLWTRLSHFCSSSSLSSHANVGLNKYGSVLSKYASSHVKVREIDSMGGDLSIKDFVDTWMPGKIDNQ